MFELRRGRAPNGALSDFNVGGRYEEENGGHGDVESVSGGLGHLQVGREHAAAAPHHRRVFHATPVEAGYWTEGDAQQPIGGAARGGMDSVVCKEKEGKHFGKREIVVNSGCLPLGLGTEVAH